VKTPYLTIDLDKIEHNARSVVRFFQTHGMAVTGVTKGVCGHPAVARAMLRGGVDSIGESRLRNIRRLKEAGVDASYMLLRIPALSDVDDVVSMTDLSLVSELTVLQALGESACARGRIHEVVLMVDLGDLREGIWPDELVGFASEARAVAGIRIVGLGTNLACFGGVVPSADNMDRLVRLARAIERQAGLALRWISGANSSALELIAAGRMPTAVNHARIGEAILLGRETTRRVPWPDTHQDAFALYTEVLELKEKPSVPIGQTGEDAYGDRPGFEDRGKVWRALLNVGREDVDVRGMKPLDPGVRILGASSGYLVADVSDVTRPVSVGDALGFAVNYGALVAAMTSEYVEKRILRTDK
jgi:predicted amino acid racemase